MSLILVVDDEPLMREFITESLMARKYDVHAAEDGMKAFELMNENVYDVILTDYKMPRVTGMDILKKARERLPEAKVVIMTAYGTVEQAVEAMKLGAFDYITKPFSVDEILLLVERALEFKNLEQENRRLQIELEEARGPRSIIGSSLTMQEIFDIIETVSTSRSTVLVTGESGTGKELVARAVHYASPRRDKPFVKLNCAALPAELMESELFGHEKGAFTGAIRNYDGRFRRADGGTLLLDEISEMSISLQAKLLRVLQEREFEPVGSSETQQVDVRIIATTNRDLHGQIEKGTFREDLYYRLNVINIELPPLRERSDDILPLANHFLEKYNKETGKAIEGISDDVIALWLRYGWPGNVRELENAVERSVVMCKGRELSLADIPPATKNTGDVSVLAASPDSTSVPSGYRVGITLADMERDMILRTLETEGGNRTTTAQKLGISVRTLRNKLTLYGKMDAFK